MLELLAQGNEIGVAWADSIIKLTTAAGFGGLVWYLVVKHIPAIEDRHRGERDRFYEQQDKRDERLESIAKTFASDEIPQSLRSIERGIEGLRNDVNNIK